MDTFVVDFNLSLELQYKYQKTKNIKSLSQRIFLFLRKNKSQEFMNRKLGYSFNQYAKWENGRKDIGWDDVLAVCAVLKIRLCPKLSTRFSFHPKDLNQSDKYILNLFLKSVFNDKISAMATFLEISSPILRRLFKNNSTTPFYLILKLFIYRPMFLLYFLNEIDVLKNFPDLLVEFQRLESLEQLESVMPYASVVFYFTDTTAYRSLKQHSSKFIALHTGLTSNQVELALRELKNRNLVEVVNRKYQLKDFSSELQSLTVAQRIDIMNYWNYRSVSYLNRLPREEVAKKSKNHTSFRVFTTTKDVADQISQKLAQTYYEINQMIKETNYGEGGEVVLKAMCLNYFGIEESHPCEIQSTREKGFYKVE